jgi:hypothetical protein
MLGEKLVHGRRWEQTGGWLLQRTPQTDVLIGPIGVRVH